MAEEKKPQRQRLISPRGVAVFPRLTTPDTKFNPEGVYQVRLRMPVANGQELMDQLDAMADEALADAIKENGGKTFKIVKGKKVEIERNDPYMLSVDEEANPTGDVEFSFSMKAQFKNREGKMQSQKPTLVDARGKAIKGAISIYGGSEIKVEFAPRPYAVNTAAGVKLYLNAVQILKLVSGGGGHSFGADDEGDFEYIPDDDDTGSGFGSGDADSGEDDDF